MSLDNHTLSNNRIIEVRELVHHRVKPRIVFFNMNGSGMGHLNRCLAYAHRLRNDADIYFFSLASAVDNIEQMGFRAEYYISHFWSCNSTYVWNSELSTRFGLFLECIRPDVVVFDGTWPFQGFLASCKVHKKSKLIWSNRGLLKDGTKKVTVDPSIFRLIIQPGELGNSYSEVILSKNTKIIHVPPVVLLNDHEIYDRSKARSELGLSLDKRYVYISLGPGNLKNVTDVSYHLIQAFNSHDISVVIARPPISVNDFSIPDWVLSISVYPQVKYLRAFDAMVCATGYNTACEVVQARVPCLIIPNNMVVDDQLRRASLVAQHVPAVISDCDTQASVDSSVNSLVKLMFGKIPAKSCIKLDGADIAAQAILSLARE